MPTVISLLVILKVRLSIFISILRYIWTSDNRLVAFNYSLPAFSNEIAIYLEHSFIEFFLGSETHIGLSGQAEREKKEYTEKSAKLVIALYFHG